jgi:hypothetical protein
MPALSGASKDPSSHLLFLQWARMGTSFQGPEVALAPAPPLVERAFHSPVYNVGHGVLQQASWYPSDAQTEEPRAARYVNRI